MSRREGGVVEGLAAARTSCRGDGDGKSDMSGGCRGGYWMWG